jgi:hypothetical protein
MPSSLDNPVTYFARAEFARLDKRIIAREAARLKR